jgi:hypothetical protein
MGMTRYATAQSIVNKVAPEVGFAPVQDITATNDPAFPSLLAALNAAAQELYTKPEGGWPHLVRTWEFTTQQGDSGRYDLPDDFGWMIDQTGWDKLNEFPLAGPVTAQRWAYLTNTGAVTTTIYATFRFRENQLWLFPQDPVIPDVTISLEYYSLGWALEEGQTDSPTNVVQNGSDKILFNPYVLERLTKLKFLANKGFDTTHALAEFNDAYEQWVGKEAGAPILNMGRGRGFPFLDWRNIPETGIGQS